MAPTGALHYGAQVKEGDFALTKQEVAEVRPMNREQRRAWMRSHPDREQRRIWRNR